LPLNNLGIYGLLACSLIVGASLASQAGLNAQLRVALSSPIQAAFISFLVGTLILGILCLYQGQAWFTKGSLSSVPWWAWFGGALGAFNIAMSIFLAPKLGAVAFTVSIICGQIIASLVLDQNGWLGFPKIELTLNRALGATLIILGMLLVAKK
jgi:transporter family-2 protein